MQSKLRAILSDRILVALFLALLVQSYRVADRFDLGHPDEGKQPQAFKELFIPLSEGGPVQLPTGDGDNAKFHLPRGEGGQHLEEAYLEAERRYGSEDPRTILSLIHI